MPRPKREAIQYYLRKRGKFWHICWSENRKPYRRSTKTEDEQEAKRILELFLAEQTRTEEGRNIIVADALETYLDHKKIEHKEKGYHQRNFDSLVFALKPIHTFFGHLYIDQITRQKVREYRQSREGRSNATIKRELDIFAAALNHIQKEGLVDKVPLIEKPTPPPPRDKWMTEAQVVQLLEGCRSHHVKTFILLALHTLSRKRAILDLKWEQVDMANKLIDFNPPGRTRTRKRRVAAPIRSKTLLQTLEEARQLAVTDYVIEYKGAPVDDIKKAFAATAKRAGLPWVTPHVIRHTGATLMAQQGVPLWEIAGLMGDDVKTVTTHYAKHSPEYLKEAAGKLSEIFG